MRTAILILIGLVLASVSILFTQPARRRLALALFAIAWLLVVLWNLRLGLSRGHGWLVELPIHLLLYVPPLMLAWWLSRRNQRP